MILWLRDQLDRIDALSLRERLLLLAALMAMIALAWDMLLMQPLERTRKLREPMAAALREEVQRLNSAIQTLAAEKSADPDTALREQLARLQRDLGDLDGQLGGLTRGLIAPQEMIEVLKQVIARTRSVTLVSLRTLPAEPLSNLVPGESLPATVYRHGAELVIEGSYLDVVEFLHSLQTLPWKFFWQRLELEVQEHPLVRVRITAHTLGEDEAWIGV